MTQDDNSNPYAPPASGRPIEAVTPRIRDLAAAVIVAIALGGFVFVATCVGSSVMAVGYPYVNPGANWLLPTVQIGSGLAGVAAAVLVYRKKYRTAQESLQQHLERDKDDLHL